MDVQLACEFSKGERKEEHHTFGIIVVVVEERVILSHVCYQYGMV